MSEIVSIYLTSLTKLSGTITGKKTPGGAGTHTGQTHEYYNYRYWNNIKPFAVHAMTRAIWEARCPRAPERELQSRVLCTPWKKTQGAAGSVE